MMPPRRVVMRERRLWHEARTLGDLGQLTARWLEGGLSYHPAYDGDPDPETAALIPILAELNRWGYVTTCSQPGRDGIGYDGARWRQRAAVEGFMPAGQASRIREAACLAGLEVVVQPAGHQATGVAVTERDGQPRTWFAVPMTSGEVTFEFGEPAARLLGSAYQVAVIDLAWGRNDVLWPALREELQRRAG